MSQLSKLYVAGILAAVERKNLCKYALLMEWKLLLKRGF